MSARLIGLLFVVALILAGCAEREVNVFVDADAAVGEEVDVTGRVLEVRNDNAFQIGPEDEDAPGAVLVVHSDEDVVRQGQVVRVEGIVRRFQLVEVERELGVDLDDEQFVVVVNQPVIVATQVQILQDVETVVGTETETERVTATERVTERETVGATTTEVATETVTVTASPSPTG